MDYVQDPPFTLKAEMSEGCCFFCKFCGIRGIRKGPGDYNFMEVATAERIAQQIVEAGWRCKIEFNMRGEPTMNPNRAEIIRTFRKYLPDTSILMTSNGGGLAKGDPVANIQELMDAGLNILGLDNYRHAKVVPKILDAIGDRWPVLHYPADKDSAPNKKRPPDTHIVIDIADISVGKVGSRRLCNHCGCAAPLNKDKANVACARPFREIIVRWDGQVPLCCNDWRGVYKCGDIWTSTLADIWQGPEFDAQRRWLYIRQRKYAPCYGCDSESYRLGLLPDKYGKATMPAPTTESIEAIRAVLARPPMSTVVPRPWECEGYGIRGFFSKES